MAPGKKTDTCYPDVRFLKDGREQMCQSPPVVLDDDEETSQDTDTQLFPRVVKRLYDSWLVLLNQASYLLAGFPAVMSRRGLCFVKVGLV